MSTCTLLQGSQHGLRIHGLTGLQEAFAGLSPEPGLAVLGVVELGDEEEVTGDLAVVGDHKALSLQLPELDVLKGEL